MGTAAPDKRSKGGVLVVDDEPTLRRVVIQTLEGAGYDPLFEASNGIEALSLLQEHGEAIHVVLLDLRMPEMGGMEVMKHLVNIHKVPVGVIVVTAHDELMTVEQFYSLGTEVVMASDYMTKPFTPKQLLADLERTTAQIHAKRQHLRTAATTDMQNLITSRLDRIESELRRITPRERSFVADLGLDLIRALVVAAALLSMLFLGVGDFVRRIIFGH